ncbi:hypothetical protein [Zwartia sp.]|uniref:hypothetical protein n=1 Tax=Zwartia sp. TaxID=2978004 RepID=UPI0027160778|nr:hypothetical protein [Zwartia sp.]MDO9024417.1 hypothetical protein [Zwartia sp.]
MRMTKKLLTVAALMLFGALATLEVASATQTQGKYLPTTQQSAPAFPFLQGALKNQADDAWAQYQKTIGQPLSTWASTEVAAKAGGTVFYPFSGPDFVTVAHAFPNADRYVMVAMQAAGAPVTLATMNQARAQGFQQKFLREWMKFSRLAFFRTDDLNEDQRDQFAPIGVTTILSTFALYSGYDVLEIYPIAFDEQSGDYVKSAEGSWRSVRLLLSKAGKPVTLDYVSLDLSDASLSKSEPIRKWLAREAHNPVLIKAASHLLQETYFSILRDILVANATMVLQDETGLNYTDLAVIGPVDLYGGFLYPHELFNRKKQESLGKAYRESKNVKPLPFAFSYNKTNERRSVQVVRRPN